MRNKKCNLFAFVGFLFILDIILREFKIFFNIKSDALLYLQFALGINLFFEPNNYFRIYFLVVNCIVISINSQKRKVLMAETKLIASSLKL